MIVCISHCSGRPNLHTHTHITPSLVKPRYFMCLASDRIFVCCFVQLIIHPLAVYRINVAVRRVNNSIFKMKLCQRFIALTIIYSVSGECPLYRLESVIYWPPNCWAVVEPSCFGRAINQKFSRWGTLINSLTMADGPKNSSV